MFTAATLSKRLTAIGLADWWRVEVVDEVDSTNSEVERRFEQGNHREGLVIFAERQSRGRGRRGATWHSGGGGENLLFSCLLWPQYPLPEWGRLPHLTGLAVAIAIEQTLDVSPLIKWPNDLMLNGRKFAGILVETHLRMTGAKFAVVGVGLNVNSQSFPGEIETLATSLQLETGREVDRCVLAAAILKQIQLHYTGCEVAYPHYLDEIRRRSFLLGKQVRVRLRDSVIHGRVEDLGSEGELILRLADGSFECISSADEVRPIPS